MWQPLIQKRERDIYLLIIKIQYEAHVFGLCSKHNNRIWKISRGAEERRCISDDPVKPNKNRGCENHNCSTVRDNILLITHESEILYDIGAGWKRVENIGLVLNMYSSFIRNTCIINNKEGLMQKRGRYFEERSALIFFCFYQSDVSVNWWMTQ